MEALESGVAAGAAGRSATRSCAGLGILAGEGCCCWDTWRPGLALWIIDIVHVIRTILT